MSKKRARQPRNSSSTVQHPQQQRRALMVSIGLVLSLSLASGILAQWRSLPLSKPQASLLPRAGAVPQPQASATPVLAKEYIYAGSRLIATEEPSSATVVNLALNKPATQSSDGGGGVASRAVDGNTNGIWAANSVTHTLYDDQAWWEVDLGSMQPIQWIDVWNRTDCCGERLSNFNVIVLDASRSTVLSLNTQGPAGSPTAININRRGRYVRVQLSATNHLSRRKCKCGERRPHHRELTMPSLSPSRYRPR